MKLGCIADDFTGGTDLANNLVRAGMRTVQVIGVPEPKYGEELCAWIRLRPDTQATEEEIREFCRGRIAHYKIPRYVRFVDAFPMTVTGKIQKFVMRRQMIEELGLQESRSA